MFRDQEFSSDLHSRAVKRIADVRRLRAAQFLEDAGPLAHPVRPDSYVEIGNFYTATVYEKGAEVIRMLHTLIGEDAFQRGMRIYFARHDGQAVTCEDFVAAMEAGSGRDLKKFRLWYSQAGTPQTDRARRLRPRPPDLHADRAPGRAGHPGPDRQAADADPARHGAARLRTARPCRCGLRARRQPAGTSRVLELDQAEQSFTFADVPAAPVPSLLRGFSAPVILDAGQNDEQLRFLMATRPRPVRALGGRPQLCHPPDAGADRGARRRPVADCRPRPRRRLRRDARRTRPRARLRRPGADPCRRNPSSASRWR